ncbi:hypothetical protein ACVWWG_000407 [Bradyrhizobium sp. LB7.2]
MSSNCFYFGNAMSQHVEALYSKPVLPDGSIEMPVSETAEAKEAGDFTKKGHRALAGKPENRRSDQSCEGLR